jgi:tetratricopeptide (TPR) repeat protein
MKRTITLLTILPMLFLISLGCQKKPSEDQLFNEAKKLQEEGKYADAVASYQNLVNLHPRGKFAPQSQFMIGFIYANELKEYDKAEKAYRKFLDAYSSSADSGMVASAEWELKNLGKDINEIEDLSIILSGGAETKADTAQSSAGSAKEK